VIGRIGIPSGAATRARQQGAVTANTSNSAIVPRLAREPSPWRNREAPRFRVVQDVCAGLEPVQQWSTTTRGWNALPRNYADVETAGRLHVCWILTQPFTRVKKILLIAFRAGTGWAVRPEFQILATAATAIFSIAFRAAPNR